MTGVQDNQKPGDKAREDNGDNKGGEDTQDVIERILGGGDEFSERECARYILNLIRNTRMSAPSAYRLCHAIEESMPPEFVEGFPSRKKKRAKDDSDDDEGFYYRNMKKDPRGKVEKKDWALLQEEFTKRFEWIEEDEPGIIFRNLMALADHLELDDLEKNILKLLYVVNAQSDMTSMMETFLREDAARVAPVIARMLNRPQDLKKIGAALGANGRLANFGLINPSGCDDSGFGRARDASIFPDIDMGTRVMLSETEVNGEDFVKALIGVETSSRLDLDDFSYLGEDLDFLVEYVRNAVERGEKGINILLYGPPGSGKTELARTIAKHLEYRMFAVGEEDEPYHGDADVGHTARYRMSQLHYAEALLKGQKGVLVNFEEPEDLLLKSGDSEKSADSDSKIQLNRLLEDNEVVRIWTANDTDKFHSAVRQRFAFSMYLGYPPTIVREKIWRKQFELKGVKVDERLPLSLARRYETPPRLTAKTALAAAINRDDAETIERVIKSDARLVFGHREAVSVPHYVPDNFDLSLLNSSADNLEEAVERLIQRGIDKGRFSLYMEGARGSGVSSLTRYMGERMGVNLCEVTLKGLSGMTGGMVSPEQALASVFNNAADTRAFLVMHDIDGLVVNPNSKGDQEWRSGLVKTFQACAKMYKFPLAVIHHGSSEVGESFKFRFSHDLSIKPMDQDKAASAYKLFFDREAPEELGRVADLLPRDFVNVVHDLSLMDKAGDIDSVIVGRLEKEKQFRGAAAAAMGFVKG